MSISLQKSETPTKREYSTDTFLLLNANWGRRYIDIFIAGQVETLTCKQFAKLDNIQFSIREKDYTKKGDIVIEL